MSIQDIVIKIKGWIGEGNISKIRLFLPFGILGMSLLLIIFTSFISGRVIERRKSSHEKPPVTIESPPPRLEPYTNSYRATNQPSTPFKTRTVTTASTTTHSNGNMLPFVASKTGKVYYPATCKSVNRIKPENRVYYESSEELLVRGYTPSKTCTR